LNKTSQSASVSAQGRGRVFGEILGLGVPFKFSQTLKSQSLIEKRETFNHRGLGRKSLRCNEDYAIKSDEPETEKLKRLVGEQKGSAEFV